MPERNTLLAAAGLSPAFPDHDLGSQALEPVGSVLSKVLDGHEPYPAWVVRQPLMFLRANAAAAAGDGEVIGLLRRAEAHARDLVVTPDQPRGSFPVVCPVFQLDGQIVPTISTVMRFDTAVEVTTSQLRIELMFPANEAAEFYFRARRAGVAGTLPVGR